MSEVKRFDLEQQYGELGRIVESQVGDYVRYEDYAKLQSELAVLREGQLDEAHELALKVRAALDRTSCPDAWMRIAYESVVANYTHPAKVVMPERISKPATRTEESFGYRNGWNACLDELERLNNGGKR